MRSQIARDSSQLHDTLHQLAGYDFHMGEQVGPAKMVVPAAGRREGGA